MLTPNPRGFQTADTKNTRPGFTEAGTAGAKRKASRKGQACRLTIAILERLGDRFIELERDIDGAWDLSQDVNLEYIGAVALAGLDALEVLGPDAIERAAERLRRQVR
jgi:hypothetical protein